MHVKLFLSLMFVLISASDLKPIQHSLYNDKLKISVPAELKSVDAKSGVPADHRFSDDDGYRVIHIKHNPGALTNEGIGAFLDELAKSYTDDSRSRAKLIRREIIDTKTDKIGVLTFQFETSKDGPGLLWSAITPFEGRALTVTFHPFPADDKEWDQQIMETIRSIETK